MEKRLVLPAELTDFLQWLHNSDFVVYVNDGTKKGVRPEGLLELLKVDQPRGELNWEISYLKAHIFQSPA